jgi:hypothetical protein
MSFKVLAVTNGHAYREQTTNTGERAHFGTWQTTTGSCACGKWEHSVRWFEDGPFDSREEWKDHVLDSVAVKVRA